MADAERPGSAARSLLKRLGMAAGVLVFGVAPWFLYRELRSFHPREIAKANILTHRGGRFYNFAGLRSFKEKLDPVWEPRSIAAPRGIALPLIVAR